MHILLCPAVCGLILGHPFTFAPTGFQGRWRRLLPSFPYRHPLRAPAPYHARLNYLSQAMRLALAMARSISRRFCSWRMGTARVAITLSNLPELPTNSTSFGR